MEKNIGLFILGGFFLHSCETEVKIQFEPFETKPIIYCVIDPMLIQWSGGAWNEVDIRFEIKEHYADSIATKYLCFQMVNNIEINNKYYHIRFPFELIVQEIDKTLKVDRAIIKRYFGPINFTIHTGLQEYANYIEFLYGINDFNENPFSNIENALGMKGG